MHMDVKPPTLSLTHTPTVPKKEKKNRVEGRVEHGTSKSNIYSLLLLVLLVLHVHCLLVGGLVHADALRPSKLSGGQQRTPGHHHRKSEHIVSKQNRTSQVNLRAAAVRPAKVNSAGSSRARCNSGAPSSCRSGHGNGNSIHSVVSALHTCTTATKPKPACPSS